MNIGKILSRVIPLNWTGLPSSLRFCHVFCLLWFSRWSASRLRPGQTDTPGSLGSLRVCRRSAGHRRSALPGLEVRTGPLRAGLAVRREREVFCQRAAVRVCRRRSRCPNRSSSRTEQRNRTLWCFLLSRYAVVCYCSSYSVVLILLIWRCSGILSCC